jgi:hypothetical protein
MCGRPGGHSVGAAPHLVERRGKERSMRKGLVSAAVVVAAAAAPASAAADMSVAVGQPEVVAGVAVTVPVTVSCSPFDPSLTYFSDGVFVTISQAVNKEIAHGSGSASGGLFGGGALLFPCDTTQSTIPVTVVAATDGPPFKRNKEGLVSASASASAGVSCGPGCFFNITGQTGSSPPVVVKLK